MICNPMLVPLIVLVQYLPKFLGRLCDYFHYDQENWSPNLRLIKIIYKDRFALYNMNFLGRPDIIYKLLESQDEHKAFPLFIASIH